jgi:methylthioribose-1-phosphate isomerase
MGVSTGGFAALRWDGHRLTVLDQTGLPEHERWLELDDAQAVADAIRRLAVRGAPLIGIAGAYGVAMEVARAPGPDGLRRAVDLLRHARPTAVNLAHAVDRVEAAALAAASDEAMAATTRAQAEAIHAEEDAASARLAELGAQFLDGARRILTHCNTGALATGGNGSALAILLALARREPVEAPGREPVQALVCETRPVLQGARLTVWELRRQGIAHQLIVDGAAAGLIRRGEVDAVIVGCDRVAANGDVANKVGTYAHALAAHATGIPFVVAGPTSSIDPGLATGDEVLIEERDPDEVRTAGGALLTLPDTPVRNPAFDVTPAHLVTALVTERGVAAPPGPETIAELLARPALRPLDATLP